VANDMQEFLKQPTDFDELISKLQIVEESAVHAAAEQPMLFIKAARARVQTMRTLMTAESRFEQIGAELAQDFRRSGEKTTEAGIKERLAIHPDIIEAEKLVRHASAQEELSKLLVEAYKHRRDAIRVIAEANIVEGNSQINEFDRQNIQQKLSKDAREAIRLRRQKTAED
jgi:hypothetical protein